MNPMNKEDTTQAFNNIREEAEARRKASKERPLPRITIGMATCGLASGALETKQSFEQTLREENIEASIHSVGCIGHCYAEPVVIIDYAESGFPPLFYQQVTPGKARMLVKSFLVGGDPLFEHVLGAMEENDMLPQITDFPRFSHEKRVVMDKCGHTDPQDIYAYIAEGGYSSFVKALELTPDDIIQEILDAGLRGRGGAGFPTGRKWDLAKNTEAQNKVVICNADEGDPGAYMDRSILEGDPHSVIEGMLIAGVAIGSSHGYIYVRNEYPLAVKRLVTAIKQAERCGLLGDGIAGTDFCFKIKISTGAGAFVCGESTALMASLEGKVGRPRAKYVHTVEKGFRDGPTNLNNVETYANVPPIIMKGGAWYAGMGTEHSKGTKVFSLCGKINNTGLVEVPMGVSLREIVFELGNGVPKKKKFKAVQTGGPSGGCIPERFLDLPVDFQRLAEVGSIMGSGGMIVMDQDTCMVDVARYFLDFLKEESCGQCNPCREGIKQMLDILTDICAGKGKEGDIELLEELGAMVQRFSLCGLGTAAPNPVLTTILYFRDEYEAHIQDKRCPAGVCKALFHYDIDAEACTGCGLCAKKCPQDAITGKKKEPHQLDQDKCIKCSICYDVCKFDAIAIR